MRQNIVRDVRLNYKLAIVRDAPSIADERLLYTMCNRALRREVIGERHGPARVPLLSAAFFIYLRPSQKHWY